MLLNGKFTNDGEKNNKKISIHISSELNGYIEEIAKENNIDVSSVIISSLVNEINNRHFHLVIKNYGLDHD